MTQSHIHTDTNTATSCRRTYTMETNKWPTHQPTDIQTYIHTKKVSINGIWIIWESLCNPTTATFTNTTTTRTTTKTTRITSKTTNENRQIQLLLSSNIHVCACSEFQFLLSPSKQRQADRQTDNRTDTQLYTIRKNNNNKKKNDLPKKELILCVDRL